MQLKKDGTFNCASSVRYSFPLPDAVIHNVTTVTEYLLKHAKLVKNNPGLVWCLEHGINKINEAISEIKDAMDEGHLYLSHQQATITKFSSINKEKDKEIIKLKGDITTQYELWLDRKKLDSTWTNAATKYNDDYKLWIGKLQDKLEKCVAQKPNNCEDKSTMTGILSYILLCNISLKLLQRGIHYFDSTSDLHQIIFQISSTPKRLILLIIQKHF